MEILLEQDSPLSSFLWTAPPITNLPVIPLIQNKPSLQQQIWPGTLSDSDWGTRALEALPHPSDLVSIVLGVKGYQMSPPGPQTSSSILRPSSMLSGTTSISPTLPFSLVGEIPIEPVRRTGSHRSSPEQRHPTPTIPPFTGMSPYRSPSNLLSPQGQHKTHCLSSDPEELQQYEQCSPFLGEGESHQGVPLMSKVSIKTTMTEGEQRQSRQQSSGGSMSGSPMLGLTPEERPYTTPTTVVGQRYSLMRNTSMALSGGEAPLPLQSPPRQSRTLPQPTTPITIAQALYLLATGKLVQIPDILLHAPLEELFNHFKEELVVDQDWARTPAGIDYAHYGYGYILNKEAIHFTCQAHNMIHLDHLVQIPDHYRPKIDLPPMTYTPEPMSDEPPVLPRRAAIPDYASAVPSYAYAAPSHAYPQGYGPPGTQGLSRLFAAAITGDEAGSSDQPQLLNKLQPPSGPPQLPAIPVAPPR